MCQLFGLSSRNAILPNFSLTGFFERGGGTDEHADGWGVALFREGKLDIHSRTSAASRCPQARSTIQNLPFSTTVLAHIRKATIGEVLPENTHPFTRNLWGREWVFAHNGDLKDFHPELTGPFSARGTTDSERAFCLLLNSLVEHFAENPPPLPELADYLKGFSDRVAEHGTFNFLLSNGDLLFAYCSTELYWAPRSAPFAEVELLDCGLRVNLSALNSDDDQMHVIATKPLTRGEVWYPMGRGELRVYTAGATSLVLHPERANFHRAPGDGPETRESVGLLRLV